MRISDWSSDVCSSDLYFARLAPGRGQGKGPGDSMKRLAGKLAAAVAAGLTLGVAAFGFTPAAHAEDPAFLSLSAGYFDIIDNEHRSEEHTSELQSLMRISYAVFCLKKNKQS